eukprot:348512-Pyramimonas_sp.AAC.1
MGTRSVGGVCPNGGGTACERSYVGLRWSPLWGHETCDRCVEWLTCGEQRHGWEEQVQNSAKLETLARRRTQP